MNNLIGVSGGIKCGKDLVGEILTYIGECWWRNGFAHEPTFEGFQTFVALDTKYEIRKCADKLKDCVCVILGCTRKQLEDQEFKSKELSEEWRVWKFEIDEGANLFDGNCQLADIIFASKEEAESYIETYKIINIINTYSVLLTPRDLLQLFGTQGGRMVVHPNIWVNALFSDYVSYSARGSDYEFEKSHWIITDVRFPENEGKAIKDRGGLLIGVQRLFRLRFPEYEDLIDATMDGYEVPKDLKEINPDLWNQLTHESETAMGDHSWCDVIIENNGTVEELFDSVLEVVRTVKQELL